MDASEVAGVLNDWRALLLGPIAGKLPMFPGGWPWTGDLSEPGELPSVLYGAADVPSGYGYLGLRLGDTVDAWRHELPGLRRYARNPITTGRKQLVLIDTPELSAGSPGRASAAATKALTCLGTAAQLDKLAEQGKRRQLAAEAAAYRAEAAIAAGSLPALTAPWWADATDELHRVTAARTASGRSARPYQSVSII